MHRRLAYWVRLAFALVLPFAALGTASAQQRFITIGTGGLTGVYYPTGGAICQLMNRETERHRISCRAESTGGSVYNLNTIRAGELDFAIAQSDWQYHAFNGSSSFARQGPDPELRSVFSLHAEPITIVARLDSGIRALADLKGRRVNVGNPGSGSRATAETMIAALDWTLDDFLLAAELKSAEQAQALCDNKIDAFIIAVGHPSGTIQEAASTCDVVLVDVAGPAIDALVERTPYYRHATIPAGLYRGTDREVRTFGVVATMVSSTRTPPEIVYELTKAVFENFRRFRRFHPAFATLDKRTMVHEAQAAPLHEGAVRYYKEAGLM